MYTITEYAGMLSDRIRMDAYTRALRESISPGCVVLDIGTGTGVFALLACKLGAERVYAVEPTDAIYLAAEIAKANGYGERVVFLQNESEQVELPEQADVIISDLRGVLPLNERHLPAIMDARGRLLADRGKLIPVSDVMWVAVVEAPDLYRRHVTSWDESSDFDMRSVADLR